MIAKQPFLPLFFGDFLASTAEWEGEEASLYLTLLGHQWAIGSLPTEPAKLCRLVRWDRRLFDKCWPTVSPKFEEHSGRLYNARLEQHRAKAQALAEKNSEAGRKGAAVRWRSDSERHSERHGDAIAPPSAGHQSANGATHSNPSHPIPSQSIPIQKLGPSDPVEQGSTDRVFDHWRTTHNHPKARLDGKRRRVITAALKVYSEADLCLAISGYLNSPHHMGQNEQGTRYDGLELMLRDAKHIDAGLKFHSEPPRTDLSAKSRQIVDATKDWLPPEVRRAEG